jgi:hypothetical protein
MKLKSLSRFSKKILTSDFMKIRLNGSRVVPCGRTDGQMDGEKDMTKLIVAFRKSANAPKSELSVEMCVWIGFICLRWGSNGHFFWTMLVMWSGLHHVVWDITIEVLEKHKIALPWRRRHFLHWSECDGEVRIFVYAFRFPSRPFVYFLFPPHIWSASSAEVKNEWKWMADPPVCV